MNTSHRPDPSGPGGFLGALRGRWQIAPGLAVLGLLAAAAYVLVVPKVYTASASVRPAAVPGSRIILLPVQVPVPGLDTEAPIVNSPGVAAMARKMLRSSLSPLALSKQVTVNVSPESGVLDISCAASSASGAASCANAFAKAYLQDRHTAAAAPLRAQLKTLNAKVTSLNKSIATLNTQIAGLPPNSPTRINDQAAVANDKSLLSGLNHQVAALRLRQAAANSSGGQVITAASPPGKQASPDKTLVLPGGLAAGLLLGLIAEFWLDRRDKRIRSVLH